MFKLVALVLISCFQVPVAHSAEPAPEWRWSTEAPARRYYIESLEAWTEIYHYLGEKSTHDLRVPQFELKAVTTCKVTEISRKRVISRCTLDEVAVILLALREKRRDDATEVAQYDKRLLTGATVDLEHSHQGKLMFIDLSGLPKNNYRNREIFDSLRRRVVVAFSSFDFELNPKYHEGEVWVQKATRLAEFEREIGNLPVAHTLVKRSESQAIFHTAGSGVVGGRFDAHLEGDALFNTASGQLQGRSWSMLGVSRQDFDSRVPHSHAGFFKVLDEGSAANVGASGEWHTVATQDTAVVLMGVLLEKHKKAKEERKR